MLFARNSAIGIPAAASYVIADTLDDVVTIDAQTCDLAIIRRSNESGKDVYIWTNKGWEIIV